MSNNLGRIVCGCVVIFALVAGGTLSVQAGNPPDPCAVAPVNGQCPSGCRLSADQQACQRIDSPGPGGPGGSSFNLVAENPLGEDSDFYSVLSRLLNVLIAVGAVLAVIMVLWAALLYTTSGGETEKVGKAHKTILYVVIGLAILIISKSVVVFVESILTGGEGVSMIGGLLRLL